EMDNALVSSTTTYAWENTWRASLGGTYHMSEALEIRCGVAYDQAPVPSEKYRNVRVPDSDRTWLSLGAGYAIGNIKLDAGYAHLFVKPSDIDKTLAEDAARGKLTGSYDNAVDIVSVQATYSF
ncbi:transporter, partial [bacterium]